MTACQSSHTGFQYYSLLQTLIEVRFSRLLTRPAWRLEFSTILRRHYPAKEVFQSKPLRWLREGDSLGCGPRVGRRLHHRPPPCSSSPLLSTVPCSMYSPRLGRGQCQCACFEIVSGFFFGGEAKPKSLSAGVVATGFGVAASLDPDGGDCR